MDFVEIVFWTYISNYQDRLAQHFKHMNPIEAVIYRMSFVGFGKLIASGFVNRLRTQRILIGIHSLSSLLSLMVPARVLHFFGRRPRSETYRLLFFILAIAAVAVESAVTNGGLVQIPHPHDEQTFVTDKTLMVWRAAPRSSDDVSPYSAVRPSRRIPVGHRVQYDTVSVTSVYDLYIKVRDLGPAGQSRLGVLYTTLVTPWEMLVTPSEKTGDLIRIDDLPKAIRKRFPTRRILSEYALSLLYPHGRFGDIADLVERNKEIYQYDSGLSSKLNVAAKINWNLRSSQLIEIRAKPTLVWFLMMAATVISMLSVAFIQMLCIVGAMVLLAELSIGVAKPLGRWAERLIVMFMVIMLCVGLWVEVPRTIHGLQNLASDWEIGAIRLTLDTADHAYGRPWLIVAFMVVILSVLSARFRTLFLQDHVSRPPPFLGERFADLLAVLVLYLGLDQGIAGHPILEDAAAETLVQASLFRSFNLDIATVVLRAPANIGDYIHHLHADAKQVTVLAVLYLVLRYSCRWINGRVVRSGFVDIFAVSGLILGASGLILNFFSGRMLYNSTASGYLLSVILLFIALGDKIVLSRYTHVSGTKLTIWVTLMVILYQTSTYLGVFGIDDFLS